ncbi:hypothetical protein MTR67_034550 [Solanum verrucosum]|uniref:Uncharacterized protein n=1 Tax=Solanum verrucosum TaxID=315347 RepID=A0AAF0ZKJ0_SOLVR|nr:hypothetical protein MTR67_034550 [Solanum verrucosum]
MKVEESVNVRNSVQAPLCHWPSTHHLFSSPATRVGSSFRGAGIDSELV